MKQIIRCSSIMIFILLIFCSNTSASLSFYTQGEEKQGSIVIGHKIRMYSELLGEWRPLGIYLPDNYESSEESYPVMVVLDGGWAFNYCVSLVDMISPNYVPRMIVVGLPNTKRNRDLNPQNAEQSGTEKFLQFLKDELFVHIGNKYRTKEYRILFGHSLAGYFTLYAFLKEPSLFNSYISSSPSLRSPERLNLLADLLEKSSSDSFAGKYVYFTGGENEGVELHESIRTFDGLLGKKKITGLKWSFNIFEGEGHVPIKGFYQGLMNNFSGWIPTLEFFRNGSLDDIKDHYSQLTKRFGFRVLPPTDIVNSTGRRYLQNNESQKAIEIFKYFVSLYPRSASGYLALGESYAQANMVDLAIQHLRKALEFEPDNAQARKILEYLLKQK